jgi:hypothetical protein
MALQRFCQQPVVSIAPTQIICRTVEEGKQADLGGLSLAV